MGLVESSYIWCIRVCFGHVYMCECICRYVYIYMHVWLGSLYMVYACLAGNM